jgi:hypothetical protein
LLSLARQFGFMIFLILLNRQVMLNLSPQPCTLPCPLKSWPFLQTSRLKPFFAKPAVPQRFRDAEFSQRRIFQTALPDSRKQINDTPQMENRYVRIFLLSSFPKLSVFDTDKNQNSGFAHALQT